MQKQNRSSQIVAAKLHKLDFDLGSRQNLNHDKENKRGYSAEGYSLLTSALRPRLFGTCVMVGITTLAIFSLFCNNANVSAVSATLSIPDGISVNVNPSSNNGFAESTNGGISVSTSNLNGYTLAIKAKDSTNGNSLVNTSNSSAKLNSITSNLTTEQYRSGNYTNTWGFKPSSINNESNTSYIPGPDSSTGITLASTHINNTDAENYSIGIAAKVDNNTIAGNYTNTFTIAATANEARYTIKYDATSLSGATNAGSFPTESNIITGDTQVINSTEPTKSGTDFLGWCDEPLQSDGTCKGSIIQAGGNLRMCKCNTDVTLYAMWGTKPVNPNANGADCTIASYKGKVYGGYCWMWQDLNGNYNWSQANSACPAGTHLPSQNEFQALLNAIGTGNQLYNAGWKHSTGVYWSSTPNNGEPYYLYVSGSSAVINPSYSGASGAFGVRCVVTQ